MKDKFWDIVCGAAPLLHFVLMLVFTCLLLLSFGILFIEPGTPEYYIAIVNFVMFGTLLVVDLGLLVQCRRRAERDW